MIKNGKYAYYKGNEYKFSRDADGNYIIITSDLKKTDCTFKDKYNTGVYSKLVNISDVDEIYKNCNLWKGEWREGFNYKGKNGEYLVSTNDCKIGEKLKLDRVDKYAYEGWLNSNIVKLDEEKQVIK